MKKTILIIISSLIPIIIFLIIIITMISFVTGQALVEEQARVLNNNAPVINSQLYSENYKKLLNTYLLNYGYVSLERLIFYLQRTNNILDTSTLNYDIWEKAYIDNINLEYKQMIPIKTMCKNLNNDYPLSDFTIESGQNEDGYQIDVIDLCVKDGVDIVTSNDYYEFYTALFYGLPLKVNFNITSFVFEHRNIDLDLTEDELNHANYHSGWDLAVPIGTDFYSICNGTIIEITNTQDNDLTFEESGNKEGNHISVKCFDGNIASYWHIKYKSQPDNLKVGSYVLTGDLLGKTSTTGKSTGGHLHLGLKDENGNLLDVMSYINFTF